ncbi:MAG: inorganic diphosphatase [Candidatus Moraniibacteriota bacterium]
MNNYATKFIGRAVEVQIDRPLGSKHPKHGFVYEMNYGFVPNTLAPDGEEIDAYILGINEPAEKYTGKCIAVIHRINDDDDKLVVIPDSMDDISDEDIKRFTNFQEQFFTSEIVRK